MTSLAIPIMAVKLPELRLLEERREGRGGERMRGGLMRGGDGDGSAWKSKKELVLLEELKQLRLLMLKEKERFVSPNVCIDPLPLPHFPAFPSSLLLPRS